MISLPIADTVRNTPKRPTGAILWQGNSRFTGAPVVAIAVWGDRGSRNDKTGDMVQVYVLCADMDPPTAVEHGLDDSVCGTCPLKGGAGCYVNTGQGPHAVWHKWRRGGYPIYSHATHGRHTVDRPIRFGAYGDCAAAPLSVWSTLRRVTDGHTGYTHAWRELDVKRWGWLMASVETAQGASEAQKRGWRTFGIIRSVADLPDDTTLCPASAEAGKRLKCAACGLCDGTDRASVINVAIVAHGSKVAPFGRRSRRFAALGIQAPDNTWRAYEIQLRGENGWYYDGNVSAKPGESSEGIRETLARECRRPCRLIGMAGVSDVIGGAS